MNNDYVAEILRATGSLRSGRPGRRDRHHSERARSSGSDGLRWRRPSGNPNPGIQLPQTFRQARVTEPNSFRRGPIGCGNP